MKKIFNLVAFFFILAFTLVILLLSESSTVHAQYPIRSADYIREIKSETVFLISSNSQRCNLSSFKTQNNLGYSSIFSNSLSYNLDNNFFDKQTVRFSFNNIYNLSDNIQSSHLIRAP